MIKKVRQLKMGILALIMLFAFRSNTATSVNINPINKRKLIVENENSALELEEWTFVIGDEIHYKLVNDKIKRGGKIIGFEADRILIKHKSGMERSIPLSGLEEIHKSSRLTKNIKRFKKVIMATGIGVTTAEERERFSWFLIPSN